MDEFLRIILIHSLKDAGFESVNQKALEVFLIVFKYHMKKTLGTIKARSLHSLRPKVVLLDFLLYFGNKEIKNYESICFEDEKPVEKEEFVSKISGAVSKWLNVYEYLPNFPPLHTFKTTTVREKKQRSRAKDIKERIDQSNKIINNLFKLIKSTKKPPKHANYLL